MFKCIFSPETFLIRTPPLDEILKKLPVPLNTLYYHRLLPPIFIWLFSEVGSFNQKIIKLLKLVSWEPTWFIGYIFKMGIYSVDFRGKECSLKITLPVSTHIRDVLLLITLALTLNFFTLDGYFNYEFWLVRTEKRGDGWRLGVHSILSIPPPPPTADKMPLFILFDFSSGLPPLLSLLIPEINSTTLDIGKLASVTSF